MNQRQYSLFAWCVMVSASAHAQAPLDTGTHTRDGQLYPGVTYSTSTLADVWDLQEEEITRYQALQITDQHYSDPSITPYEVLGKYARSQAEAERYAAIVINKELDQFVRAMEWAATVDNVRRARPMDAALEMLQGSRTVREYLSQKGIDVQTWIEELTGTSVETALGLTVPGQHQRVDRAVPRVSYFVDAHRCDEACEARWKQLRGMQAINAVSGIDVVFIGDQQARPSKRVVSGWAQSRGVTVAEVDRHEVTLNFESARFAQIRDNRETPVAIDSRGEIIR